MYILTNYRNLFADELTDWLINKVGFKQSQFQIYKYYKYVPYGTKIVALSYVDDCIYWYTSEAFGFFVDNLGKIFHVNFLVFAHWFM